MSMSVGFTRGNYGSSCRLPLVSGNSKVGLLQLLRVGLVVWCRSRPDSSELPGAPLLWGSKRAKVGPICILYAPG